MSGIKPSGNSTNSMTTKEKERDASHHHNLAFDSNGHRRKSILDEEDDKSSIENSKSTRHLEVETILKYFNHDTNHMQDLIINEMRGMDIFYEDKR